MEALRTYSHQKSPVGYIGSDKKPRGDAKHGLLLPLQESKEVRVHIPECEIAEKVLHWWVSELDATSRGLCVEVMFAKIKGLERNREPRTKTLAGVHDKSRIRCHHEALSWFMKDIAVLTRGRLVLEAYKLEVKMQHDLAAFAVSLVS